MGTRSVGCFIYHRPASPLRIALPWGRAGASRRRGQLPGYGPLEILSRDSFSLQDRCFWETRGQRRREGVRERSSASTTLRFRYTCFSHLHQETGCRRAADQPSRSTDDSCIYCFKRFIPLNRCPFRQGTSKNSLRIPIAAFGGTRNPHVLRVHSGFSVPSGLPSGRSSHVSETPCNHHIDSGADMPRILNPLRRTCLTQSDSSSRAVRIAGSALRIWHSW